MVCPPHSKEARILQLQRQIAEAEEDIKETRRCVEMGWERKSRLKEFEEISEQLLKGGTSSNALFYENVESGVLVYDLTGSMIKNVMDWLDENGHTYSKGKISVSVMNELRV